MALSIPSARRWHGYDWFKLVVAVVLAASLIRVGPAAPAVAEATAGPTVAPTAAPTAAPPATVEPTAQPTAAPTAEPTAQPSATPAPTPAPAATTEPAATAQPTAATSAVATGGPLAISSPQEGAQLESGPLTVTGTGTPGTEIEVLDSDRVAAEATVGDDGTWSAEVQIVDGTATIGVREKGAADVTGRPIRVTVGEAQDTTCEAIAIGCPAYVTRAGGLTLRMRSSPQIAEDNVVARLPIGTELELLEGPQAADGFSWWQARSRGGSEGWVAGENLVPQPD
jgi:hypothetical protein